LDRGEASTHVIESARRAGWRPPAQAHLLRSLVERVAGAATGDLRTRLAKEIHDIERIVDLANEFPALSRMETPFRTGFGKAWVGWGDEPWLVTLVSPAAFASPLVIAVSSSAVPSSEDAVLRGDPARGTPLGDGFVDVYVDWPPDRFAPERATPTAFYALGIGLILGVTALAGHLLLRDVNREVVTAEMRSQFVASVSHELKTPLTAIRMFAETLAAGRFHTESQRIGYLDTIRNESERLSRLVDNVLDFSRIERGKKIFHMETVALQPIVESAARAMRYPLAQKGFELAASIDASVPPIHADPDALEQAILNLLTNAMKYSGDSRYIGLDLRPEDHEAVLEVRDRGLGIAPEEHSRVFDKFYRVRSAELDRIAGAGLGLTLAVHIVKAHRGRIEVSSTPGEGSSFSIRLPLDQELPQ
jgi:signal transduction histidine kinase